jgi:hypothetical protein
MAYYTVDPCRFCILAGPCWDGAEMSSFPRLVCTVTGSGQVWYWPGEGLVDRYLEFVAGWCRPNMLRAVGRSPFPTQPGSAMLQVRRVRKGRRQYLVQSALAGQRLCRPFDDGAQIIAAGLTVERAHAVGQQQAHHSHT